MWWGPSSGSQVKWYLTSLGICIREQGSQSYQWKGSKSSIQHLINNSLPDATVKFVSFGQLLNILGPLFICKLAFKVRSMFAYKSCQTFLLSPSQKHTDVPNLLCLLASRHAWLPCKTAHFSVPAWGCLVQASNWIDVETDYSFIQDSTLNLPLYLSVSTEVCLSLRFPCLCNLRWMHVPRQRGK